MQERERDELETLVNAASTLMDRVTVLARDEGVQFTELARRSKQNRILSVISITGLILDVILSIALAFGGYQLQHLTHRIDVSQTTTRQKALCPMYQVFLDSKSAAGRNAAPDPKKYDHAFVVIKEGYEALNCDEFISGNPAPVSSAH
jgi:hypothetical protein